MSILHDLGRRAHHEDRPFPPKTRNFRRNEPLGWTLIVPGENCEVRQIHRAVVVEIGVVAASRAVEASLEDGEVDEVDIGVAVEIGEGVGRVVEAEDEDAHLRDGDGGGIVIAILGG
ncbi:MAG: hypothetical protein ACREDF_02275, partial [Thermoplasmata archaeon]